MQNVWWDQIKKARAFVEEIADNAISGRSLVVNFPESIPWPNELLDSVEAILREKMPEYCLTDLGCPTEEPEHLMLERFCRRETRATYRRSVGAAKFLASVSESPLHSSFVWVHIASEEMMRKWITFASEYIQSTPKGRERGVFIFETRGQKSFSKIKNVSLLNWIDSIDSYDIYTFCALSSSEISIPSYLRPYLVELASVICGHDVELGQACVDAGGRFMENPSLELQAICRDYTRSNGDPFFLNANPEQISALIWEAQLRIVFPMIEKYRSRFVQQHAGKITACLPTVDRDGREICGLKEVELGIIIRLVGEGTLSIPPDDYALIDYLRKKRNDLAHLTPIAFSDIQQILGLEQIGK